MEKLWTRNFTILTIGSLISALGNSAASVGFGILVYQQTGSPLTLAFFTIANIIPRIITGFIAGPFVDRHSRRKIIYRLDFLSSTLFLGIAIILFTGYFQVIIFTLLASVFGIIDTIYQLAFMSMFPEVITKGNHSKAYSLSSLIWPLSAAIMAPIAAFMIETYVFGIALLMAFNAITHFLAASVESTMRLEEILNQKEVKGFQFIEDLKEGFHYYRLEKGIFGIAILFAAFSFVYASQDLLRMPYFISSDVYTIQHFSFIISASSVGRILGGIIHYTFKYPPHKRYLIAVSVYFTVEFLSATMLYMPYVLMVTFSFIVGLLSVTSFNIRMTATQVYIPTQLRGRVNSTQNLLWNIGAIIGALVTGLFAEFITFDYRFIMLLTAIVSISAILLVPVRMNHEFKKIYNADI
ncbi:MAG TPA: MFS transporter [Acholeplasmataceae bacterium]|nr:MFS transporter [Acholeplasmataceae bacterium]